MIAEQLKTIYASSMVLAIKARASHHNVEGHNFYQYHQFFDDIYQEIYGSTDQCAELIRQLDGYAPGSLSRFLELSIIPDQSKVPRAELMISELLSDNLAMVDLLKAAFDMAESEREPGIADFIAARIDAHAKHAWQLRSTLKHGRN